MSRGAVKNQFGFSTYYRIKRVSYNTFRDMRFYGHFFDESPDLRIRTKSSNRYDFNPRLYHFTTYVYHKSGENLRYHFGSSGRFIILMSVLPRDLGEPGWFMTRHRLHFNWSHCLVTILDIRTWIVGLLGSFPCFVGAPKRRLRRP